MALDAVHDDYDTLLILLNRSTSVSLSTSLLLVETSLSFRKRQVDNQEATTVASTLLFIVGTIKDCHHVYLQP